VFVTLAFCVCMCDCAVFDFSLFLSVMLVGLRFVRNKLNITVAPPGFCNRGEVRYGWGSRVRSPQEADTFTAVHREVVGFGTV